MSDGSKCDCGNILDVLGSQNKVAITDPVYPVYVDTNVMAGHTGEADESGAYAGLVYLKVHGGKRVRGRAAAGACGRDLSLFPE